MFLDYQKHLNTTPHNYIERFPKSIPRMLVLAERPWRRREAVSKLEDWLRNIFLEAGGGSLKLFQGEDGWIIAETDDEQLLASILRLNTRLDSIASRDPPHTAKIVKTSRGKVFYEYPLPDGLTVKATSYARDWAAQLGYEGDDIEGFLEALGVVEGMSISTSLNMPSLIQKRIFLDAVIKGLDRIILIDLAPQEVEEVLELGFRGFTAIYETITPLTHIVYLKLGASLEKASKRLGVLMQSVAPKASHRSLDWRKLSTINWDENLFEI